MHFSFRVAIPFALCCLVLTSCGKPKEAAQILGKWKMTTPPAGEETRLKNFAGVNIDICLLMKPDGTFILGPDPQTPAAKQSFAKLGDRTIDSGKYSIDSSDKIQFKELQLQPKGFFKGKDKDTATYSLSGDDLTLTASDGTTAKFTRLK